MSMTTQEATMPRYVTQPKPQPAKEQEALNLGNREALKSQFARKLYEAIMSRGWTQSDFARHCGLNRDAISTYVRGKSVPSPQSLERMAEALNMRPEDLMPNYYEAAHAKADATMELRDVPNEEGYMWLKLNMRLPKKVAINIFMQAQEHA
jgi:transcriptional regulator with XRE-family HTH domain